MFCSHGQTQLGKDVAFLIFVFLIIIVVREVICYFFKVNRLLSTMESNKKSIDSMQQSLSAFMR